MLKVGDKVRVMKFDDVIKKFPDIDREVRNTPVDWVNIMDNCGYIYRRWLDIDLDGICVIEGIKNNMGVSKSTIIHVRGNRGSFWVNEKFVISAKPKYINKER